MATLRPWGSTSRSMTGISTIFTAESGIQAISEFSSPLGSSISRMKSGSSRSRSWAVPSSVSSSKKRTLTIFALLILGR